MDIDAILKQILSNTFTEADCYRRLLFLQDFFDQVIYQGQGSRTDLKSQLLAWESKSEDAAAAASWGEDTLAWLAEDPQKIAEIKAEIEALPELVLYAPAMLPRHSMENIGAWCRANIDPAVLIDLKIDLAYVGGCAFAWKGQWHDFSLGYFFDKHRQELSALFNTYDNPNQRMKSESTTIRINE